MATKSIYITAAWIGAWLAIWTLLRSPLLPSPFEVVAAFPSLWSEFGLGPELLASIFINVEALIVSSLLALPLAWLSRTEIVRPLAIGLSKLRFLSPASFFLLLIVMLGSGVKLWMLVMGESFFLLTTMLVVVQSIPTERFDDAKTLCMTPLQTCWYVIVLGTVDQALEAIRDNAAIGWAMLMMVEGIVRSEGGVGVMLISQEKFFNYDAVYAIILVVLAVGVLQDYLLTKLLVACCPWVRFA